MVNELTEQECRDLLARSSMGRLGSSQDDQPHVLSIYFAFEADYFYVLSTIGQKIEWMRANPKVCVEVDGIRVDHAHILPHLRFLDDRTAFRSPKQMTCEQIRRCWKNISCHH